MKRSGFLALTLAALTGCTLAPFYHRPALPVTDAWPISTQSRGIASNIGWRDFFGDPNLQQVIELALQNNRDLRIATLNVAAARAEYGIRTGALFPTVDAVGSESVERASDDLRASDAARVDRQFKAAGVVTAYEIDLFGRLRSLRRAALENYFSLEETQRSAHIALVSQVAIAYLTWVADRELLQLTRDTFNGQMASYQITRQRSQAGIASALDLAQAETAVATARANFFQYTRQVDQDWNALTFLVGTSLPADIADGGPSIVEQESILADLPQGLPSDLLERRPDIRAAEHDLKAANANVGAARAAFFPTISLTGSYGTASHQLSRLFQAGTGTWLFSPQISMPIFEGGAGSGLKLANVEKRIEVTRYERTIQQAFREVADALAGRRTLDEQVEAQEYLVAASSRSYSLSNLRFRNGVESYLTVIVSQRALYDAQQTLIQVKLQRLANLVTLYQVLGGGWSDRTLTPIVSASTSPAPVAPLPPALPEASPTPAPATPAPATPAPTQPGPAAPSPTALPALPPPLPTSPATAAPPPASAAPVPSATAAPTETPVPSASPVPSATPASPPAR